MNRRDQELLDKQLWKLLLADIPELANVRFRG
jgi:hypothetical protein